MTYRDINWKAIQPISDLSLSAVVYRLIPFQLSSQVILLPDTSDSMPIFSSC